ncbi:GNAT family N-acetyltransferase [Mangrovihabitans endophyticus]|uniref:GNAT family N-acetyltransferase n=1 Tax=Mangrovihabitans endophyticus TaxID=1751298 RepID=UPI00166E0255|nr:GNAT family N-acetyltransferase [Mangrovihabitans endophyticus]
MVPEIRGDGVRLRPLRPDDLDDLVAGMDDPLTQRFLPALPSPFTRSAGEWYLERGVPETFAAGGALCAVADPHTDRLLGGVGLDRVIPARRQAEMGYWVGPWARHRGVATAAVRALTDHALTSGMQRLELLTHAENGPSQRVALAAGFRREGVRRGALPDRSTRRADLIAYARLAGDAPGPATRLLPDLPGGELTDGTVTLRRLGPGDAAFYAELHAEPDVIATSVPPVPPSHEDVRRRCDWAESHWLEGTRADLVIVDSATGAATGHIGLFYQEPPTAQAMIGYSMSSAWRGRGYATRAAQLLALWAFAETGIARLIAGAMPSNRKSRRVLEKAGFREEAYLRSRLPGPGSERIDDVQYVLLAEDLAREGPRLDG